MYYVYPYDNQVQEGEGEGEVETEALENDIPEGEKDDKGEKEDKDKHDTEKNVSESGEPENGEGEGDGEEIIAELADASEEVEEEPEQTLSSLGSKLQPIPISSTKKVLEDKEPVTLKQPMAVKLPNGSASNGTLSNHVVSNHHVAQRGPMSTNGSPVVKASNVEVMLR